MTHPGSYKLCPGSGKVIVFSSGPVQHTLSSGDRQATTQLPQTLGSLPLPNSCFPLVEGVSGWKQHLQSPYPTKLKLVAASGF